ncbi:hypothetical protein ACVWZA_003161 [Sphingomonas sp. UYAg733]
MHGDTDRLLWWQTRWFVAVALIASMLPLISLPVAPLTDLPGHIGRYRILADAGVAPLSSHYAVHWALIGNLGIDLLVRALRPLLDVEPAMRLVVTLIPPLAVAAMLWLAREVHGRVQPTTLFALPLVYAFPFQLGFVNFTLAATLSLAGLALWIRLARIAPLWVRILLFVPVAGMVWLCHSFGWAMLGLFVFGAEWALRRDAGARGVRPALLAALVCIPMAWPQILAMSGGVTLVGDTGDWFHWLAKAQWVASMLRERWKLYDVGCVVVLALLLWTAIRSRRLSFSPILRIPALLGLAAFILLPRLYAGGSYVDMRLLPWVVALALIAIRVAPGEGRLESRLALAGTGFFALRTVTSIAALTLFARAQQVELGALAAIPTGSSVLTLVQEPSPADWDNRRLGHIAGLAIARRHIFTNEQWSIPGQQLIRPIHPAAMPFDRDPSQLVFPLGSDLHITDFDGALASFDRGTFSYVWTIGFPIRQTRAADLIPVWTNGRSALYRVMPQPAQRRSN